MTGSREAQRNKMRRVSWLRCCRSRLTVALLLPFLFLAAVPATAEDRALLIGIDQYQDPLTPATPGARADAQAMAHLIQEQFAFAPSAIRVLQDGQATAEAIVESFRSWLIDGTNPGDRVFFFYAGHGSQLPDDNNDEEDGLDETLAPYDVDPRRGTNHLRDDLLDSLIAQLTGRRAVLLFDSCHSGTISRSGDATNRQAGAGVRLLPRPDQFQSLAGSEGESLLRSEGQAWSVAPSDSGQQPFDDPTQHGLLSGIVVLSAAGAGQLAYPIEVAGGPRGAFSYAFEQIYREGEFSRNLFSKFMGGLGGALKSLAKGFLTGGAIHLAQDLTLDGLAKSLAAAMQYLREQGLLPEEQNPEMDIFSPQPLDQGPLYPPAEQAPVVALSNPLVPGSITLQTADGRSSYRAGEELHFQLSSDRPGYLYLLVFSDERRATCIYPNPSHPQNQIGAGLTSLPDSPDYVFPVEQPYGRDVVIALIADQPKNLCQKVRYNWDEIYEQIDLRAVHETLRARTLRGIGVQPAPMSDGQKLANTPSTQRWQTASLVLETTP